MTHTTQVLSDEQIEDAVATAIRERRLSWLGFKKDEDGAYTIPVLSPSDYQFARIFFAIGQQPAPAGDEVRDARWWLEAIVDIWKDLDKAPEHRMYVSGALDEAMQEAEAMLSAAQPAPVDEREALRVLLAAVDAETSDEWTCNSYHPSLASAAEQARATLQCAQAPQPTKGGEA